MSGHEDHRERRGRSHRAKQSRPMPVMFVFDHDPGALSVVLSGLARRFGNDFAINGETSPGAALAALRELAVSGVPVALLLVEGAAIDLLARAHALHPRAKRVLLVDRDYSSASPAVRAMTLGQADFHIVRPWADDEITYRAISEYLSSWTREHEPRSELFRIVASESDSRLGEL